MITIAAIKQEVREMLWPSPGEPRNLRTQHDRMIIEAMADLAKWVGVLQQNNTNLYPFCSTYIDCGLTVFNAPYGRIKRVFTIANGNWADRVFYTSKEYASLLSWAKENHRIRGPAPGSDFEKVTLSIAEPNPSTDSPCGRARVGCWTINRKRLYLAPWIQSNETIVVEWDGVKTDWKDEDGLDDTYWDVDARAAIRLYVAAMHESHYGCDRAKAKDMMKAYADALADLMQDDRDYTHPVPDDEISSELAPSVAMIEAEAIPTSPDDEIFFANIGDYGRSAHDPLPIQVADLVKTNDPDFIVTNGDNNYGTDYDFEIGRLYSDYLYPYIGIYGAGASEMRFFPVPGNHDYAVDGLLGETPNTLASYKNFFVGLPGNGRYYEFVKGPVHFFMLNSDPHEQHGNTSSSAQAEWLRTKMQLSTAKWKIVVIHDAPYQSSPHDAPGILSSRWPFKDWGADLVFSGDGHFYERLEVEGLPYIVNGLGGNSPDAVLNPSPPPLDVYSQFKYNALNGAGFCRVTCDTLQWEFKNTEGTVVDTLELTK